MKLTRKQELALIDIGLQQVINNLTITKVSVKPGWTPQRRKKFMKTVARKFAKSNATKK